MRLDPKRVLLAVLGMALLPYAATASDMEAQLKAMQERLGQLEDKIEAQNDQLEVANERIEDQQALIQRNQIATESSSGLAAFLETLEIGGWVSGSYYYNFDDPDGRDLAGSNAGLYSYPFKPDSNSFQLDQVWFELERPVSEENRAGFRVDMVIGKTGDLLNGGNDGFSGSDEDFHLYQGYVQYLAPIGNGVTFQFGKFGTLIGAEVAQAPYNFNISRGHVYNLFQPITHTGILASTEFDGGYSAALGFVNETRSFTSNDIDLNKNKAVLWSLGWGSDEFSASFAGVYGDADSGQGVETPAGDKELILDFILGWDPSENFSAYINADYIDSENSRTAGELDGYGIAVAGRYALNDRMGLALRGEYVDLDFDSAPDLEVWGITSTVDYALTEQLKLRGELRYDNASSSDGPINNAFTDSAQSGGLKFSEDDQLTAGVEVIYSF